MYKRNTKNKLYYEALRIRMGKSERTVAFNAKKYLKFLALFLSKFNVQCLFMDYDVIFFLN